MTLNTDSHAHASMVHELSSRHSSVAAIESVHAAVTGRALQTVNLSFLQQMLVLLCASTVFPEECIRLPRGTAQL